jgi:RHS repeat-associated protein
VSKGGTGDGQTTHYNGLGQRIGFISHFAFGSAQTNLTLDVQPGLHQTIKSVQGSNIKRYVFDPQGIQRQQLSSGSWQYMITDGLGSVRAVVDSNLNPVRSQHFAPYGTIFGSVGSTQTDFYFTGEPVDRNGLYLRARYYMSQLGVFPSLDPVEGGIGDARTVNRYAYVQANPVNYLDPHGKDPRVPVVDCPDGGTFDSHTGKCCYDYIAGQAIAYASSYKASVNPNYCGFNYVNPFGPSMADNKCSGGTDCANFVSQALVAGGLPMTQGWYCHGTICGKDGKSPTWAGAQQNQGLPLYLRNLIGAIDVHPTTSEISISGIPTGETIENLQSSPYYGTYDPIVQQSIFDVASVLVNDVRLSVGDMLYTDTPTIQHTALIVGWGPYLTSWQEVYEFVEQGKGVTHTCDTKSSDYSPGAQCSGLSDVRTSCCSVPYVIDHGNHFLYGKDENGNNPAWAAGPKPYYALKWGAPFFASSGEYIQSSSSTSAASKNWGFVHLPQRVCFSPIELTI